VWLREQGVEVTVTVEHAALDPFRGYMNAIRDELPDATAVLDAFHVVKLAGNALDEVRRRVQQAALHRPGHKDDPLYRIRRTLLTGTEHLTDRQRQRLDRYLPVGDPHGEVELAWSIYQAVRGIYDAASPARGREQAEKLLDTLHTCPIKEVARLGRTLRQWRAEILAYFTTGRLQWRHRGHQRRHREDPTPRARLPQLHQLPHPHSARRRRLTPLPTPTPSGPIKP
jgi:transposase